MPEKQGYTRRVWHPPKTCIYCKYCNGRRRPCYARGAPSHLFLRKNSPSKKENVWVGLAAYAAKISLEKKKGLVFMNIFDEINSLPEALIARRLGLSTARDGKSFICPACGNGSGKTGDGIKQTKFKGKLVWHCYRCDGHWSNVDLIGRGISGIQK